MKTLTYRILGYNLDFGVVRIEGQTKTHQDVVVFASQSIEGELRLSAEEVLFISKTGEAAKLNLRSGTITQRAKPFRHHGFHNKLFLSPDTNSLIAVSNNSISLVDLNALTVQKSFNAVLREKDGTLRLHNYEDIKAPFEAKAKEERDKVKAWREANPKAKWEGELKWSWAREFRFWPVNTGDAFRPDFQARNMALREDGILIVPFTTKAARRSGTKERLKGFGLARIDLKTKTLRYEELHALNLNTPNSLTFKALSDDGRCLLLDRHKLARFDGKAVKPKRLFGFGRRENRVEFEHLLEVWWIEDTTIFSHHLSVGTTQAILEPEKPSEETKRKYPSLYKNELRDFEIETCRLEAAKQQFQSLFETQIWSKEKFKSDFVGHLKQRNIEIDETLAKALERDHILRFGLKTYIVDSFLDMALKKNPEFFDQVKHELLEQIKLSTKRFTQNAVGFEWQSIDSDLYILERSGRVRQATSGGSQSQSSIIEGLPTGVSDGSSVKFYRRPDSQLYLESTLNYGEIKDGLLIDLPIRTIARDGINVVPTKRVYDVDSFKKDHDVAEKLARKARRGYVTVRSKSAKNLTDGLAKLTKEYAQFHEEMVLSARWDAGLFHKKTLILEKEIARIIVQENDISAIPALTEFVETIMRVAAKDISPIPSYPRDLTKRHVHWDVWHNDDGAQVGMPSVNALIALSDRVPELALTFYRYRDFEHDVYTDDDGLLTDVLPHVSIEKPSVLNLLAIVSFQLLATGRVQNDLFAQHGMDRLANALETSDLNPKLMAQVFADEVKGLKGELSWGDNLGPHGLVAQAVYGLDKSHRGKMAFGKAMLEIYPEARAYLAEKIAS